MTPVRKTSVHLTEQEAEQLRMTAVRQGRSQAELIREGVRRVIAQGSVQRREFRSLGMGHGEGTPSEGWRSGEFFKKAIGER